MPKQVSQSSLAAKIKAKAKSVFEKAKTSETSFDTGGNLPAGIEGGIARLVDCSVKKIKEGKQNAGELMFYAAGVVVSPEEVAGVNIKGLRTSITENLFDTPQSAGRKTFGEHLENVLNELKKLGADLSEIDEEDVEQVMAALKEEGPYFRFRTWVGAKQTTGIYAGREPRVNHVWNGRCDYVEDDATEGVVDETAEEPADDQEAADATKVDDAGVDDNLASLAQSADNGDEDAQRELEAKAKAAGIDANDYPTWAEVATAMEGAVEAKEEVEEEAGEEEEEKPFEPEVGEVYSYKAPGKKKAVDHEVMAVLKKTRTITLKDLDTGKMLKGIPWAKIEG